MVNKKEQFSSQLNFSFLTNNVKGLQSSEKPFKIFEHFRNKVAPEGILFLQETHCSVKAILWNDIFKGQLYFSHGKTNSCDVLTAFYGNINVVIKKQLNDKIGRILILEVTIDNTAYLLINIYNAHTERHQLETLHKLSILLEVFDNFGNKNVVPSGDFNLVFNEKLECKGGKQFFENNQ